VYPNSYKLLQIVHYPLVAQHAKFIFFNEAIISLSETTMRREQFSNLFTLNTKRDVTNSLNTKTIIDSISATNRKIVLILYYYIL